MSDLVQRLKSALADRYAIDKEVGSGGMATVYLAEDLKHHRKVAVKVLRPDLAATLGPERFLREIEIAAQLQHPHILTLIDSGEADGFLYYVMPYVEGESLREQLTESGELPIMDAVRIIREVVDALAHAHAHGVVHRDIKPDNVLLSGRHAMITDFGVAKAVSEATGRDKLTTAGVALGTPAYMAPEQATADPHVDHRADIYAVGVLAYELLTGRPPFVGTTPQQVLAAHVTEVPDVVSIHRASVPPVLAELVMKCLEKKPADRWQSAVDMLPLLEGLTTPSGGVTPTGMQPVTQTAAPASRPIGKVVAAVAGLAIVVVGGFALLRPASSAALVPNRVVVGTFDNRTSDPALADLGSMAAMWITEGLQRTGIVDVIPSPTALQASQFVQAAIASGGSVDPVRALAEETGAGIVISGTYFQIGDSLQFQAQITDATAGALLGAPVTVSGAVGSPTEAIERLRERVMGLLAISFDDRLADQTSTAGRPPTHQAYREFNQGMEAYLGFRWQDAYAHFERAYELDTTFAVALVYAALGHANVGLGGNLGQMATTDSIMDVLSERRDQLSDYHRLWVDYLRQTIHADHETALRTIRSAAEMAPGSKAVFNVGYTAWRTSRPQETVDALTSLDPERGPMRGWGSYFEQLTAAYHVLGDYQEELAAARRGAKLFPEVQLRRRDVARALIGLGRIEEADSVVEQIVSSGAGAGVPLRQLGDELRAHGFKETAAEVFDRAIVWHEAQARGTTRPEQMARDHVRALYAAGRGEEVRANLRFWLDSVPGVMDSLQNVATEAMGRLGVLAARRGEGDEAMRWSDELARLTYQYEAGATLLWRARIAAVLGDRDQAVNLLRERASRGHSYTLSWTHRDADLESLYDYQPFIDLIRPKR